MYEPRSYRVWSADRDLVPFHVVVRETDLYIRAERDLTGRAHEVVIEERAQLEGYIQRHPGFATAMEPFTVEDGAPALVREMAAAAAEAGVGPMAAVAGAIAERVGRQLLELSPQVVVENGGDIFLVSHKKRLVGIHTGRPPFEGRLALEIDPEDTPVGVCTSSGTVGHSLSLGTADAVVTLARNTALADAAATATGNLVRTEADTERWLAFTRAITGISGVVIVKNDRLAVWGKVQLVQT